MDLQILDKVEKAAGSNQKKLLLAGLGEDTLRFLRLALDPGVTFGVTVELTPGTELPNVVLCNGTGACADIFWDGLMELCLKLRARQLTGNAAGEAIDTLLSSSPTWDEAKWAARILNKDLRSGYSYSTLNKVFPASIDKFQVALAEPYDPERHEIAVNSIIDRKLDGLRMVVLDGVAYTRNGKVLGTVGHILALLERLDPDGLFVFDGEVMGKADFDTNSGAARRQSGGTNTDLVYHVFDCVRRDEWQRRKTRPLLERKKDLEKILPDGCIDVKPVPYKILPRNPTSGQLFAMRDELIKQGFEGAMVKNLDAPYVFKRSDNILKLKDFVDIDVTIVELMLGKGRLARTLGKIRVQHDSPQGITTTKVGSGFTDDQRDEFWARRNELLGKTAECQYQNFTKEGTLRFPIFIKLRPDKDE